MSDTRAPSSALKVRIARRRVELGLMDRDRSDAELDVVLDAATALDDAADFADFSELLPRFDSMEVDAR